MPAGPYFDFIQGGIDGKTCQKKIIQCLRSCVGIFIQKKGAKAQLYMNNIGLYIYLKKGRESTTTYIWILAYIFHLVANFSVILHDGRQPFVPGLQRNARHAQHSTAQHYI